MEEIKNTPLENFDWDAYENGTVETAAQKEDQEKAYDQTLNKVSEHEVVEGKIIALDKRQAIVDIGYKSDGVIPISDFRYNPDVKVGDVLEFYIESL